MWRSGERVTWTKGTVSTGTGMGVFREGKEAAAQQVEKARP